MTSEQFSVSWDNFHKNMSSGVNSLLENEDFVDVTLAVEGRYLKAHKMVLSVCSSYFRELFKTSPCKHPIVFMKDVSYTVMSDLLQFMYQGEVQVSQENFNTFIKTAESLQIRGLSNYDNGLSDNTKSQPKEKQTELNGPKRPRLNDDIIVKTEPEVIEPTSANTDSIELKTEPCEQEESSLTIADDNSNENFFDDPLDDTNEDYWMMDDEAQVGTSTDGTLGGEDSIDGENAAVSTMFSLISDKSKEKYEHNFTIFEQWCCENNVQSINENVLMTYFKEKSLTYKSSSLWTMYSMLRSMISMKKSIDISKYKNLLMFLKGTSEGYKAKKSRVFKREDFERFLKEADDYNFLMMKVVLIIGVTGACRNCELTYLRVENVIDEGNFIRIQIPDSKNKISREFIITSGFLKNINFIEILRKYINLRPAINDHQRFFVNYRQGKCTRQAVGINTLAATSKNIARFLGLSNFEQYTGHCIRKTSAALKLAPQLMQFFN